MPCTLLERRVGMHNIPKGQNLTQRSLEHFYFWGCVDEVRAARLLPPEVPAAGIVTYPRLARTRRGHRRRRPSQKEIRKKKIGGGPVQRSARIRRAARLRLARVKMERADESA